MRTLILLLLFANFAFFGWAHWIASDPLPRVDIQKAAVPRLKLAREVGAPERPTSAVIAASPPGPAPGVGPQGPAAAPLPPTAAR